MVCTGAGWTKLTADILRLGSLVRIGPNAVITSDIDLVNRINSARSPYIRSDWYLAFRLSPGVDNVYMNTITCQASLD